MLDVTYGHRNDFIQRDVFFRAFGSSSLPI